MPEIPFGHVVVHLLKGVIARDDQDGRWQALLQHDAKVREHLRHIGLDVVIDEAQGYAFARQRPEDPEQPDAMPRLIPRRPLRYHVSLLLVLLRKRMILHDETSGEARLVLSFEDIVDQCRQFFNGARGEQKMLEQIEQLLDQASKLGFVRAMPNQDGDDRRYEVRRILKAFIDAEWLQQFSERLQEYAEHAANTTERV